MKRRTFAALLAGAPIWSLTAMAQQPPRLLRIGVLMDLPESTTGKARIAAFVGGLARLGWQDGRNLEIDYRWEASDIGAARRLGAELVARRPAAILVAGSPATAALQRETTSIPVIFTSVTDPVGAGFVSNLARPESNLTGFLVFEYHISAKWLELLAELVPDLERVVVLLDPSTASGLGQLAVLEASAAQRGLDLLAVDVRDIDAAEARLASLAGPKSGVVVTGSTIAAIHGARLVGLSIQKRLPAIFAYRHFVDGGGLASYGPDLTEPFARAAEYVDRILKGARVSELPVQAPIRYDFVLNLRTAAALGLSVSPILLAHTDALLE